ncbi:protein arginine kinase [Desulforudis sp. 1088]|uniref:protein arginine kinase n=2 Tax=Candidatus Desulforudis TaxID=471826 RepID=UPI00348B139A
MGLKETVSNPYSAWMRDGASDGDVVVSSRIRLARALADYPFPHRLTPEAAEEIVHAVELAVKDRRLAEAVGGLELSRAAELSSLERQILVEKHLASPAFFQGPAEGRAIGLSDDESVSIMVNEEDHLRIQVLAPGLQLEQALEKANVVDDALERTLDYAYSESIGYLTACPTNVGTGLRASLMLHLPGLAITGQVRQVLATIGKLGLTVRGLYGEGTEAAGNLFQISNQITLGRAEEEIVQNLVAVCRQIIDQERAARRLLHQERPEIVEDRVWRAYGILRYARLLNSREAIQYLSDVRLGIDLGIIKDVSPSMAWTLMVLTRPAFILKYGGELSPHQRDVLRAGLVRETLAKKKKK